MPDDVVASVRETLRAQQLLTRGARVVVAVSGGADSVALLHLLCALRAEWNLSLHVAHLDHGLRDDSREDAAFVRQLSDHWHVTSTIEPRDVSGVCTREGWSLEDGARRIRYEFFRDVAVRHRASHLALAHTADDQAETVLMRVLRGTGLLGLGAMPIKRPLADPLREAPNGEASVWLVRPLLHVWRRDLVAYLSRARLTYREDASNRDSRFVRNRIRHELLPVLERDYNPNIKGTLAQLAEQSQWDYAYLQDAASRQWKRLAKATPAPGVSLVIQPFLRQPKALQRQLLRRTIQRVRGDLTQFEFRHWVEAERLFVERPIGTVLDLPGGIQLRRERERVVCQRSTPPAQPASSD